jgi:hypothetical protein
MYGVTPDMLGKMYVAGSLKNGDDGFSFEIKNKIESGSVSGIAKMAVDGDEVSLEGATVTINDKTKVVSDISWSASLYVPYGATLKIAVPGALAAGEHTINMQINVPELGRISIPITDTIG